MTRQRISRAILIAVIVAAGVEGKRLSSTELAAQAPGRQVPTFEVDKAWPKLPPKYKVGDASSFAIDAQDNVWVLHRPRTLLKPDEAKMAAPPVVVFDAAGNFVKAWGGDGNGYEWPQREHGIHIDYQGLRLARRQQLPDQRHRQPQAGRRRSAPQVHAGGQVRAADRQEQSEQGQRRHARTCIGRPTSGCISRPTSCSSPTATAMTASSSSTPNTGAFKRMWGAFGNKPMDDDNCEVVTPKTFSAGPGPQQFQHRARDPRVEGRHGLCRRPRKPPRPGVHTPGRQVRQPGHPDRRAVRAQPGALARSRAAVPLRRRRQGRVSSSTASRCRSWAPSNPRASSAPGHQIATDSKGNLYIAATGMGMQKLDVQGNVGGAGHELVSSQWAVGRTLRGVLPTAHCLLPFSERHASQNDTRTANGSSTRSTDSCWNCAR